MSDAGCEPGGLRMIDCRGGVKLEMAVVAEFRTESEKPRNVWNRHTKGVAAQLKGDCC